MGTCVALRVPACGPRVLNAPPVSCSQVSQYYTSQYSDPTWLRVMVRRSCTPSVTMRSSRASAQVVVVWVADTAHQALITQACACPVRRPRPLLIHPHSLPIRGDRLWPVLAARERPSVRVSLVHVPLILTSRHSQIGCREHPLPCKHDMWDEHVLQAQIVVSQFFVTLVQGYDLYFPLPPIPMLTMTPPTASTHTRSGNVGLSVLHV
jgi:hypothetical protein